jgi:phospholipase/carboxylesterase
MSQFVLGGFSQGGMLATDVTLSLDEAPHSLQILSASLVSAPDWRAKAPRRRGLKVLQSHGRTDPILGYAGAEALRELLTQAGLSVQFEPFDGGHTIPNALLPPMGAMLEEGL